MPAGARAVFSCARGGAHRERRRIGCAAARHAAGENRAARVPLTISSAFPGEFLIIRMAPCLKKAIPIAGEILTSLHWRTPCAYLRIRIKLRMSIDLISNS
ncbi:hypothetical protein [Burkholderia oklahomensis]|uniref:hypothetical protein n=1 Tax=Burkholderia oklahomensis TaxID=342113 RepID=UPI000F5214C3|nr:hypothetical protein [Burkholderia oklahomensis]MBI0361902.1 hypothetical protein [Burkholderia oklahomensis]